jgi:hypothetical protein
MGSGLRATFVAHDNLLVLVYIHFGVIAILDATGEDLLCQGILKETHHGPT